MRKNLTKLRARGAYNEYIEAGVTAPSAMVPVTRMYDLVDELEIYI